LSGFFGGQKPLAGGCVHGFWNGFLCGEQAAKRLSEKKAVFSHCGANHVDNVHNLVNNLLKTFSKLWFSSPAAKILRDFVG